MDSYTYRDSYGSLFTQPRENRAAATITEGVEGPHERHGMEVRVARGCQGVAARATARNRRGCCLSAFFTLRVITANTGGVDINI